MKTKPKQSRYILPYFPTEEERNLEKLRKKEEKTIKKANKKIMAKQKKELKKSRTKPAPAPAPAPTPSPSPTEYKYVSLGTEFPPDYWVGEIPINDVLNCLNGHYIALQDMNNGIVPYATCNLHYREEFYGATSSDGLILGDPAMPALNNGVPRWEVMAHEQTHNFLGGTSPFYYALATPYPFLQESLAVTGAFYVHNYLMKHRDELNLSVDVLESLLYDFSNGFDYQSRQFNKYVEYGRNFSLTDVTTSQALDYTIITLANEFGWDKIKKVMKAFSNQMSGHIQFYNPVGAQYQASYMAAVLVYAFGEVAYNELEQLNFPLSLSLYRSYLDILKSL